MRFYRFIVILFFLLISFKSFSAAFSIEVGGYSPIFYGDNINTLTQVPIGHCVGNSAISFRITGFDSPYFIASRYSNNSCSGEASSTGNKLSYKVVSYTCPVGEEFNPETGQCEQPPPPPFCSQASTQQQMRDYESSCLADGGSPTIICNDRVEPPDFRMACDIEPPPPMGCEPGSLSFPGCLDDENKCDENHPDWDPRYGMCCSPENDYCDVPQEEPCTMFSPNWDECRSDSDVNPPSGGDLSDPTLPDGGGSGSPSPDKEQPEVEGAENVRDSIYKMNDDLNGLITAMNNDMNKNHAESKSALDALKASTDTNTQSVIDGANHVAGALNAQSDMLSQIGNNTNSLLTSNNNLLNNGFGELTKGLNSLGDGVAGVASGLSGLNGTNEKGFGDVVTGIGGLTDKLGQITDRPINGSNNPAIPLYSSEKINDLLDEVSALETEYTETLNSFKDYFYSGEVNSGDYVAHSIELNWHGVAISQNNVALDTLRDNAAIIGAIVIFLAGLAGIRAIGGSF